MNDLSKGLQIGISLAVMRNGLILVQAAHALALEGTTRATATQITKVKAREYSYSVSPLNMRQVFAALKIKTVTHHGRKRYVLDIKELEEIREALVAKCEELSKELGAFIE
ncbi:hypothetical protein ACFLYB_00050 [Chloroflexota bacterium]